MNEFRKLINVSANRSSIKEGKKQLAKKLNSLTRANSTKLKDIKWIKE